jgi:hypothetical protein
MNAPIESENEDSEEEDDSDEVTLLYRRFQSAKMITAKTLKTYIKIQIMSFEFNLKYYYF